MFKMRGVYGALAVHCFDVFTDILVISEWFNLKNEHGDNIDPQVMAYSAIAVLLLSKVISTFAIYLKDRNMIRCVLQLFDLLIFVEVYECHQKISSKIKQKKLEDKIEPTLSFKYVRNCEAVFESIPESVLQLVWVMRTSKIELIFVLSIIQSIISMTNTILNNDYTQMQGDEWKKYKQKTTPEFLQHSLCRVSEITYRIGLLSLFWTVCEGLAFGIMLAVELCNVIIRMFWMIRNDDGKLDADTVLINLSTFIVIPSEEVYAHKRFKWTDLFGCSQQCCTGGLLVSRGVICSNCCCCTGVAGFIASLSEILRCKTNPSLKITWAPITKIGFSLYEIIVVIFWALFAKHGERTKFLFSFDHGLGIFIVTIICYLIYSQYRLLFPDFSLPFDVNIRSQWGYALANELSEMKKIRLKKTTKKITNYKMYDAKDFWDEPYEYNIRGQSITAAVIALAMGHHHIVKLLEAKGAVAHKDVDLQYIHIPTKKELDTTNRYRPKFLFAFHGNQIKIEEISIKIDKIDKENKQRFWDQQWTRRYRKKKEKKKSKKNKKQNTEIIEFNIEKTYTYTYTPAIMAMLNGHDNIVKWLENQGAVYHKQQDIDRSLALKCLQKEDNAEKPSSIETRERFEYALQGNLNGLKKMKVKGPVYSEIYGDSKIEVVRRPMDFWDEPAASYKGIEMTAAVFALYKRNDEIVEWLQEQGAFTHTIQKIDYKRAAQLFLDKAEEVKAAKTQQL
eukprot:63026_1